MKHTRAKQLNKNYKLKSIESDSEEQMEYEQLTTTHHSNQCKCSNLDVKSAKKEIVYMNMPISTQHYDDDPKCKQCKRDFFSNHNEFDLVLNQSHMFQCNKVFEDKYTSRTHNPPLNHLPLSSFCNKTYNANTESKERFKSVGKKSFSHEDEGKVNLSNFSYNYRLKQSSTSHPKLLLSNDERNECCQAEHFDIPKERKELRTEHSQVELFGSQDDKLYQEPEMKIHNLKKTVISENRALMIHNKNLNDNEEIDVQVPYLKKTVQLDYSSQDDQIETQQELLHTGNQDEELVQPIVNDMNFRTHGNSRNNKKEGNPIESNEDNQTNNHNQDSLLIMNRLNSLQNMMASEDKVIKDNGNDNKEIEYLNKVKTLHVDDIVDIKSSIDNNEYFNKVNDLICAGSSIDDNENLHSNAIYEEKLNTYIYNIKESNTNNLMSDMNYKDTLQADINSYEILNNNEVNSPKPDNKVCNYQPKDNTEKEVNNDISLKENSGNSILIPNFASNPQNKTEITLTGNDISDLQHNNDKTNQYNNNAKQAQDTNISIANKNDNMNLNTNKQSADKVQESNQHIYTNQNIPSTNLLSIQKLTENSNDDMNIISQFTSDIFKILSTTINENIITSNICENTRHHAINEINTNSNILHQADDSIPSNNTNIYSDLPNNLNNNNQYKVNNMTSTMYQPSNTNQISNDSIQSNSHIHLSKSTNLNDNIQTKANMSLTMNQLCDNNNDDTQKSKEDLYLNANKHDIFEPKGNQHIIIHPNNTVKNRELFDISTNSNINNNIKCQENITSTNYHKSYQNDKENMNKDIEGNIVFDSNKAIDTNTNDNLSLEAITLINNEINANNHCSNEDIYPKPNMSSNIYRNINIHEKIKDNLNFNSNENIISKSHKKQIHTEYDQCDKDKNIEIPQVQQSDLNNSQYINAEIQNNTQQIDDSNENLNLNSRSHQEFNPKFNSTSTILEKKESNTERNNNPLSDINQKLIMKLNTNNSLENKDNKSNLQFDISETNVKDSKINQIIKEDIRSFDDMQTNGKCSNMNDNIDTKTTIVKDTDFQMNLKNNDDTKKSIQNNLSLKNNETKAEHSLINNIKTDHNNVYSNTNDLYFKGDSHQNSNNIIPDPTDLASNSIIPQKYRTIHEIKSNSSSNDFEDTIITSIQNQNHNHISTNLNNKDSSESSNLNVNKQSNNVYQSISMTSKDKLRTNIYQHSKANSSTFTQKFLNTFEITNALTPNPTLNIKELKLKSKLNALQLNIHEKSQIQLIDDLNKNTHPHNKTIKSNRRLYSKLQSNTDTYDNFHTQTNSHTKIHSKEIINKGYSKTSYIFEDYNKIIENNIIISPKNKHKRNDRNNTHNASNQKHTPIMLRAKGKQDMNNSTSDLNIMSSFNKETKDQNKVNIFCPNIRFKHYKESTMNKSNRTDNYSKSKENLTNDLKSSINCLKIETLMNNINKENPVAEELNFNYAYERPKNNTYKYLNSSSNFPVEVGKLDLDQLSNIICDNPYQPLTSTFKERNSNTTAYLKPLSTNKRIDRNIKTEDNLKHYPTNSRLFSPSNLKSNTNPLSTEETYNRPQSSSKDSYSYPLIDLPLPLYSTCKTKVEFDSIIFPPNYIGLYEKLHGNLLTKKMKNKK